MLKLTSKAYKLNWLVHLQSAERTTTFKPFTYEQKRDLPMKPKISPFCWFTFSWYVASIEIGLEGFHDFLILWPLVVHSLSMIFFEIIFWNKGIPGNKQRIKHDSCRSTPALWLLLGLPISTLQTLCRLHHLLSWSRCHCLLSVSWETCQLTKYIQKLRVKFNQKQTLKSFILLSLQSIK